MDSWTKEQVEWMRENGNIKSNMYYNPNEGRHPPPENYGDASERDSELEQYIRGKYEYRKFIDRAAIVASKLGPSRSASSARSQTIPAKTSSLMSTETTTISPSASITDRPLVNEPQRAATTSITTNTAAATLTQPRSASQPVVAQHALNPQPQQQTGVWSDLISLQGPSANSSLPLQYSTPGVATLPTGQVLQQPSFTSTYQATNAFSQMARQGTLPTLQQSQSLNPLNPFGQTQIQPQFTAAPLNTSMSLPQLQAPRPQGQLFATAIPTQQTSLAQSPLAAPQGGYFQPQPQLSATPTGFMSSSPQPLAAMNRASPFLSTTPQLAPIPSPGQQLQMMPTGVGMGSMNPMSVSPGIGLGFGGGAPQAQLQNQAAQFQQASFVSQMMPPGHQQRQQTNPFGAGVAFGQQPQQWGGM
ncbi:hypothetical protein AX16_008365 [Volvariella volvacea WC 439]|nr:hypothetical protein AX16_008365 [Volvariella volvacea WC 439]